MNKIKQLHLEAIQSEVYVIQKLTAKNYVANIDRAASKSAEVTQEAAIEFAEWRDTRLEELNKWILDGVLMGNKFTTKELYNEFLKTKTL